MDVMVERCAGLDVGKDEVVGCVRTPSPSGQGPQSELRTFVTFTSGLEALADWLTANGVTEVVMEATGPYWKPIWYVLEDRGFDLKLVNAKHVKMVPGRKTDVADAAWLAAAARARPAARLVRAAGGDPRAAGPDPLPQTADPDPHRRAAAGAEDARGRRDQARLGRLGRVGRVGPR